MVTEPRLALVDGTTLDPGRYLDDVDPSTGAVFATTARGGTDEIDAAVRAARAAQPGWRRTPVRERARMLLCIADLIEADAEALALTESRDTGKPLSQAQADVSFAARYFAFYGQTVQALYGETIPVEAGMLVYTLREPHGVTGHIIPWNYPLQVTARTVAASLATGNCAVLKPAEEAPLNALRIGEIALEAGVPPGALNVVPGLGEEAGAALAAHPGIDHLSFTGSVAVGRSVAQAAGANLVPVTLELGGKSPNIVFPDADLDVAVPTICRSILQNAGQTCSAGSRLLVHHSVHEEVVRRLHDAFSRVRIGPGPNDPDLGPLISSTQRERVARLVSGHADAGDLRYGGTVPDGDGFFYPPTLVDHVDPASRLAREEVFGPVLAVLEFTDTVEAVRLANSTNYGLIAAVWTGDAGRAHWVAAELESGQVFINNYGAGGGVELPFGGVKESGFGREKGFEALRGYTRTKSVAVATPAPDAGQ